MRAAYEKDKRIGIQQGSSSHIPQAYYRTHFDSPFSAVKGLNTNEFDTFLNRPQVANLADYHQMATAHVKINYAACEGGVKPEVTRALVSQLLSAIQNGKEVDIGFSLVALNATFFRAPKSAAGLMVSKDITLELIPMSTADIIADAHTDPDAKRIDEELATEEMKDVDLIILGFLLMIMGKKPAPLQTNWEKYVETHRFSIGGCRHQSPPICGHFSASWSC